ncbi:dermonecrotic toxin domain-containing protein [Pseudomonas sp. EL_65y_Pfl1_R83]|uniref:dermonecrotic toxin domain-containing protein n=1 Tax=Pseudomonas sp. EL_65y_Pfl1_R83 TaxID=3088697 RepID=UPI0030DDD145
MSKTSLFDILPAHPPAEFARLHSASAALGSNENAMRQAHQRLQRCREEMLTLMAATPTVRTSIRWYLQQRLELNSDRVSLHFFPTDTAPRARFNLTEACGFFLGHPQASTDALRAGEVVNLPAGHRYASWSATRLLESVRVLDLKQALLEGWNAYWMSRAPGTGVSRRERAAQLYKTHFEVSAQFVQASRVQRADQFKVLQVLIDPHTVELDGQHLYTEQMRLTRANGEQLALPGAWVVTLDSDAPVNQLLYLPFHDPAWQLFSNRTDLERWLLDHQQTLFKVNDPLASIHYQVHVMPLDTGINQWLASLGEAQYQSTQVSEPAYDLIEGSISALITADERDQQRQSNALFAPAPALPATLIHDEPQPTPTFGLLSADLPASERQGMITQQLAAIEQWLGNDENADLQHPRVMALKQQLDTLHGHQDAAATAAWGLLTRGVFDVPTLNTHFTALHSARLGGLLSEALIQHTLGQLTTDEHALVQNLLTSPAVAREATSPVAATLNLSLTRQLDSSSTTASTTELIGPFLITTAQALTDPANARHSVLLYWPGAAGGLQRFNSRQDLEQSLLHLQADETALAVSYTPLTGDPLNDSLRRQQTAFDTEAATIRSNYPLLSQRENALENLRLRTLDSLLVPAAEARDAAFMQLIEQNNSSHLATRMPSWLQQTPGAHSRLKTLIEVFPDALAQAQALIARSLPEREGYLKRQIDARLRKDFALKQGFSVQLELPDSVEQRREPTGGAAPGTPVKVVNVPSAQRSSMTLEALALGNIDEAIGLRMAFKTLTVRADDATELATLKTGLTHAYLFKLARDLNLAQKYENLILDTFKGNDQESLFATQYRRECLLQPWRLTLHLQGECAHLQGLIDAQALRLLQIATDADRNEAWNVEGKRIRLLPAHLSAGTGDTGGASTITLSGITFIEEQNSGQTLLYLPEVPDGQCLRPYANLEQARKALFDRCAQDSMARYVAGCALEGAVAGHLSRLQLAHQQGFDAMIGVGLSWPTSTSLAAHQLDAYMGRLLQSHRNDSRSNADLTLQKYALQSDTLFKGIKIALGVLPVIGTAVNLGDGVISLYNAVDAFRQGKPFHGITELVAVFESLVYALLDIAPAMGAPKASARAARQLTRVRQASRALHRQPFWSALPRQKPAATRLRFEGYAYEKPLSLADLQPQANGIYRQVYRHAEGDFILHQGLTYQVEYDKHLRALRLSGTRSKTYKQPIGLNERGQWDTHGGLYGTLVDGGLAGGGNLLGHLADQMDPLWPAAIREWLPRWWTDHTWRQHQRLMGRIASTEQSMGALAQRINVLLPRYAANDLSVISDIERVMDELIALAKVMDADLVRISSHVRGNRASLLRKARGDTAQDVVHCAQFQVKFSLGLFFKTGNETNAALAHLNSLPFDQLAARTAQRAQVRRLRVQTYEYLRRLDTAIEQMNHWLPLVQGPSRTIMVNAAETINRGLSERHLVNMKAGELMDLIVRRHPEQDVSWHYLQGPLRNAENTLSRALYLQLHLLEAGAGPAQRNQILRYCIAVYGNYRRQLNSWRASAPMHFDDVYVEMMHTEIEKIRGLAEKALTYQSTPAPRGSNRRVFESVDNVLLIGETAPSAAGQPRRYTMTGPRGHEQIWEQTPNGRFHLTNPLPSTPWQPTARDLPATLQAARYRLEGVSAHRTTVEGYARRGMSPNDLEFMMTSEADSLNLQARHIEALDPQASILPELRRTATELTEQGRQLRIEQICKSQTPTEGYLDYLLTQRTDANPIVDIRKTGPIEALGKRQDGRPDFMQEYEVRDLRSAAPQVLWYAHFHYESSTPRQFDTFVKAHLKIPSQRRQGLKWQQIQAQGSGSNQVTPIWRGSIGKPFAILHFKEI